eukprot:g45297.t1
MPLLLPSITRTLRARWTSTRARALEHGSQWIAVYPDFQKALNKVQHERLLHKMKTASAHAEKLQFKADLLRSELHEQLHRGGCAAISVIFETKDCWTETLQSTLNTGVWCHDGRHLIQEHAECRRSIRERVEHLKTCRQKK